MILIYLITLLIAPQLWIEPFVGVRVDLIVYPLWILVAASKGKLKYFFDFQTMDYFIVMYIVWIGFSIITNETHELTGKIVTDYIKWFILYRLVVITLVDIEGVRKAAFLLVFLIFIIVIEGIMHKLSPDGLGWAGQTLGWVDPAVLRDGGTGRTRWINIFDGPGVFCVMYTLGLPFVIRFFDKHYTFTTKLFAGIITALFLLAIWYTGSRGGFLATLGVIGGYLLFRNAAKLNLSIGKMAVVGVLLVGVFMAAPSHLTQVKDEKNSAQHRVDMWLKGLQMVRENPLFGIGRGNYGHYTRSLIAHNSAIENMGELGLPGLFFWIGIFYIAFRNLFAFTKTATEPIHSSLSNAVILCLVGYLISSMFVTLEYETMFFIFAMAAVIGKSIPEKLEFTSKDYFIIGGTTIGWYMIVRVFTAVYY